MKNNTITLIKSVLIVGKNLAITLIEKFIKMKMDWE